MSKDLSPAKGLFWGVLLGLAIHIVLFLIMSLAIKTIKGE